jgi:molybdenum cofactor cytidylyltransferase
MSDFDCVMLAAGQSRRMEQWKMTLPLDERTLIEAAVRTALEVCGRVILVAGFRAEELEALFRGQRRVQVVENRSYEKGMFSSVRRGCREVRSPRFFLALGDMPRVSADTYRELVRVADELDGRSDPAGGGVNGAAPADRGIPTGGPAYEAAPADRGAPVGSPAGRDPDRLPVIIPRFRGKKGHPLLLSAGICRRVLSAPSSWTLRDVLAEMPNLLVPVDDPCILQDVDTPEDYRGLTTAEA